MTTRLQERRDKLSPQEMHVLLLACDGASDREIAEELGISLGSVRTYWERMRAKYNATSRINILALVVDAKSTLDEITRRKG